MDREIIKTREQVASLKIEARDLRTQLTALSSAMSTDELETEVHTLAAQKAEKIARLKALESGKMQPVDQKEKATIEAEHRKWKHVANARKKIFKNMWATVTEEMPEGKTKEDLWVSSFVRFTPLGSASFKAWFGADCT